MFTWRTSWVVCKGLHWIESKWNVFARFGNFNIFKGLRLEKNVKFKLMSSDSLSVRELGALTDHNIVNIECTDWLNALNS